MLFSGKILKQGDAGVEIEELQIRLAGFGGTIWSGNFGPNTKKQVMQFQKDYIGDGVPSGVVDLKTLRNIITFTEEFNIDFNKLKCPCGKCNGFGLGKYKNVYIPSKPKIEAYYMYEYPGIHKAILYAYRACMFYAKKYGFPLPVINCGYRCSANNIQNKRSSTNHCGKAIDIDLPMVKKTEKDNQIDTDRCNTFRTKMIEFGNFQIGWSNSNQKSLEPENIAPTWIHMDIRNYESKYLLDRFFVKSNDELNK